MCVMTIFDLNLFIEYLGKKKDEQEKKAHLCNVSECRRRVLAASQQNKNNPQFLLCPVVIVVAM